MRHAAFLVAALVLGGCRSTPSGSSERPATPRVEGPAPTAELVAACAKHLELLHRQRLSRELARDGFAALAGPAPTPDELAASRARIRGLGLTGDDEAFASASGFAQLAQPTIARAGYSFLGWTPELDDVGLAKIRARRPGRWKQLWAKGVEYEVVLLDGFTVPEYRHFFEDATGHKEGGRDVPRLRGKLVVIDAKGVEDDAKRAVAEKNPAAPALAGVSTEDLLAEIELREASYLRFQSETTSPSTLDQLVTWLEILEGNPDLALAGGVVSAGDARDELRRAGAVQAIVLKLAAADEKEERAEVLTMPPDQRRKRLKELAPHFLRAELGH